MTTLFPCYAPPDRAFARKIVDFLERGADLRIFFEEGELRPGENLAAKAREGRMAEIVLVLFSRVSLPSRWPRAQWEDALVKEPQAEDVRIAFVRLDDCVPPPVLTPRFEARQLRELKRWVRNGALGRELPLDPDLDVTGMAIADRPGNEIAVSAEFARRFADVFAGDFGAVLRLECHGRSLAALAGDLAAQLEMHLEGPLEENLDRLRQFCAERRLLFLFEGDPPEELIFGGRCSTLTAPAEPAETANDELRAAQYVLSNPTGDWAEICRQARNGRRLTRNAGRIAECYELMCQWHAAARQRDDRAALDESARELIWILESWGRDAEARELENLRAAQYDEQMSLEF